MFFLYLLFVFPYMTIHLPNRVIRSGTNSSTYHSYIDRSWNQISSENFNNYNIKLIPGLDYVIEINWSQESTGISCSIDKFS